MSYLHSGNLGHAGGCGSCGPSCGCRSCRGLSGLAERYEQEDDPAPAPPPRPASPLRAPAAPQVSGWGGFAAPARRRAVVRRRAGPTVRQLHEQIRELRRQLREALDAQNPQNPRNDSAPPPRRVPPREAPPTERTSPSERASPDSREQPAPREEAAPDAGSPDAPPPESGTHGWFGDSAPRPEPEIVRVRGIRIAASLAPRLEALLAAAEADGVRMSGWGYRSKQRQIELRREHCGPTHYDIWEKPSSQCRPPTATPGRSMHERGLAIDFTQGGHALTRESPGFRWLMQNAARFGLRNLPSEPWHWSVNGR